MATAFQTPAQLLDAKLEKENRTLQTTSSTLYEAQVSNYIAEREAEGFSRMVATMKATTYFTNLVTAELTAKGATVVNVTFDFVSEQVFEVVATFYTVRKGLTIEAPGLLLF